MANARAYLATAVVFATIAALSSHAQEPPTAPPNQSAVASTTAILVDVVVRDRSGRPVTDLSASDFELSEDGTLQVIDSFTRVSRGGGIGVSVAWRSPTLTVSSQPHAVETRADDPVAELGATAIVFDNLSSEALHLAQKATLAYLPLNGEAQVRVGVFTTETGIRTLQTFTTDRALIRSAVANAMPSGISSAEQKAERTEQLIARRRELQSQNDPATGGVGTSATVARNSSALGQRETELQMLQTELNMLRAADQLDRDTRGFETALALVGVVRTLALYPGRKSIVFFSEGLPASPALSARLDTIIEAANRANITAYAIDANGLRTRSASSTLEREINTFAEERFRQLAAATDRTNQPLTMGFERVEDTLRLDSRTGLARLANDTGGLLIEDSNDLSSAFRRIDEDTQFHYLLTYSPTNTAYDGKFRAIQVRVKRPRTEVFARRGYRALTRPALAATTSYEAPALALLDGVRIPNDFQTHAGSFTFAEPARPGLTAVVLKLSTRDLRFDVDSRRSTYSASATLLVRIRDADRREVQRVGQQYLLTGAAKDLEAGKHGEILFYRELDLTPGVYSVESIALDESTSRASARVSTLTVPHVDRTRLSLSSLIIVGRVEDVASDARHTSASPFQVGQRLVYPNLGQEIQRSRTTELPFFFALYTAGHTPTVTAQLLHNGHALAEAPVPVSVGLGSEVQHLGRMPVASLRPGTYELRIRAVHGAQEVAQSAFFTIVD